LGSVGVAGKNFKHTPRLREVVAINDGSLLDEWLAGGLRKLR